MSTTSPPEGGSDAPSDLWQEVLSAPTRAVVTVYKGRLTTHILCLYCKLCISKLKLENHYCYYSRKHLKINHSSVYVKETDTDRHYYICPTSDVKGEGLPISPDGHFGGINTNLEAFDLIKCRKVWRKTWDIVVRRNIENVRLSDWFPTPTNPDERRVLNMYPNERLHSFLAWISSSSFLTFRIQSLKFWYFQEIIDLVTESSDRSRISLSDCLRGRMTQAYR